MECIEFKSSVYRFPSSLFNFLLVDLDFVYESMWNVDFIAEEAWIVDFRPP